MDNKYLEVYKMKVQGNTNYRIKKTLMKNNQQEHQIEAWEVCALCAAVIGLLYLLFF